MNAFTRLRDGLANVLTGRGTSVDKAQHHFWHYMPMGHEQILAAYRASWLIRRIVDLPCEDMVREWRIWAAKPEEVVRIEELEGDLRIYDEVLDALTYGRLGGGILLIGASGDPASPISDGEELVYVKALPKNVISLGDMEWDVSSPNFGSPAYYTINGSGAGEEVHPDRVIVFKGERLPAISGVALNDHFWGQSIVEVVDKAVKNADAGADGFASMIDETKVDIFKLAGLAETLMQPDGDTKVKQRMETTTAGKSMHRAIYLDGEDEWQQKQVNWSGIPDIIKTYLMIVAGAADIPATRLFGKAPDGQNSTGESDDRNYRSMILTKQNRTLRPVLKRLDKFLLPSAKMDADKTWTFAPLSTPTEKERADVDKIRAETAKIWNDTGLIPDAALAKGAQSMLAEAGTYPALEEELEKLPEADLIPDPERNAGGLDPSALTQGQPGQSVAQLPAPRRGGTPTTDAEPRTLYVRRDVLNAADIIRWAKSQGFTTTLPAGDMHVTIAFSRTPVDWMKVGDDDWQSDDNGGLLIKPGGVRLVDRFGDATVLLFTSSTLSYRHERLKHHGATWDHDDFQPHITLTYAAPEGLDLAKIVPYRGPIRLGPEIFEEVDPNWSDGIEEV